MQGQVFLIREKATGEDFAAKIYETMDEEKIWQIKSEARILESLKHPNIIDFKQFYCLDQEGLFIIITDYFSSISLESLIETKSMTIDEKNRIATTLITVVEYLRGQKITHADFNSSNILINPETMEVRLIDFGLSRSSSLSSVSFLSPKGLLHSRPPLHLGLFYQEDLYDIWGLLLVLIGVYTGRSVCSSRAMRVLEEERERMNAQENAVCQVICDFLLRPRDAAVFLQELLRTCC